MEDPVLVEKILDDVDTAPIPGRLRATLELLRKMTLDHAQMTPADVRAVLQTGVSKSAVEDALEVAFLFNIYDRLADAMGWDVPSRNGGYYETAAKRLLKYGYR